MATCPRCKGHLTDSHRCPRRRGAIALQLAFAGLAGGAAGLVLVAAFDPVGEFRHVDSLAIVLGALAGIGVDRVVRARL